MDRVPKLKQVSVRVPTFRVRRMATRTRTENFRVPNNFGSGFWFPNTPMNNNLVFVAK